MPRLILVRHGEAAAGWGADADPGLSDEGRRQAEAVAEELVPLGPLPIVVSPLRRTRETAAPLERRWATEAGVHEGVGEVRTPDEVGLEARATWLGGFMGGRWSTAAPGLQAWRSGVLDTLASLDRDTVVVTHFVAINVAVGAASGDDRVVSFAPANCSRTILEADGCGLRVVELGDQGVTVIG
jgi:broad specificity phosphatase PhoE